MADVAAIVADLPPYPPYPQEPAVLTLSDEHRDLQATLAAS